MTFYPTFVGNDGGDESGHELKKDLWGSIDPHKLKMHSQRNGKSYAALIERDDQDMCPAFLNERWVVRLVETVRDENGFFRLGKLAGAAAGVCTASQMEGLMVKPSTF